MEENNFEVVTSENADFQNSNKNNSYEACLDAIETVIVHNKIQNLNWNTFYNLKIHFKNKLEDKET